MTNRAQAPSLSASAVGGRFDALDFARGLAILAMFGSHLVGTEGGATLVERGITSVLAAIEPTVGALFCLLAGMSWSIQAERVGVTPRFRRYLAGRALALGVLGVVFHILFWKTEILVPFALMMLLSAALVGSGWRMTALALLLFIVVTPAVERFVEAYVVTDWLSSGLHAADTGLGWVTLRYLLVDGNYPLISWMAFPLMGMLFWQTVRNRRGTVAWLAGSLAIAAATYAIAAYTAGGVGPALAVAKAGWTPTSAVFLLTAGGGALVVVGLLLLGWGTGAMPRFVQPVVLLGRASLSHYVLHIAVAYSTLRLWYPDEDWLPGTGLVALFAYLAIGIPATMFWFRHHTHGPLEALLARTSRRPTPPGTPDDGITESQSVEIIRREESASLHATRSFASGEAVFPLEGRVVDAPTRFTIQLDAQLHLTPVSDRMSPWAYLNHSCDPNVAIDVSTRTVMARRSIVAGEELRFDYNTTEWELAEPFACNCGAPWCVGMAMGFARLSSARQQVMLRAAAPHIRTLYATLRRGSEQQRLPASASGIQRGPTVGISSPRVRVTRA